MQSEYFHSNYIPVPDHLREKLLKAPSVVKKQKRERAIWLTSILFILSLNVGLYLQQETKRQEQATAAVYQYLTQTYHYPWKVSAYCAAQLFFWFAPTSSCCISYIANQSTRQDWVTL